MLPLVTTRDDVHPKMEKLRMAWVDGYTCFGDRRKDVAHAADSSPLLRRGHTESTLVGSLLCSLNRVYSVRGRSFCKIKASD